MTEQFIVFDTEYASWQGFLNAPEEEKKKAEIVQIAALKINSRDLSVAEKLNLYVKPRFAPKLTDYFINLTGITDELLAQGRHPLSRSLCPFQTICRRTALLFSRLAARRRPHCRRQSHRLQPGHVRH